MKTDSSLAHGRVVTVVRQDSFCQVYLNSLELSCYHAAMLVVCFPHDT